MMREGAYPTLTVELRFSRETAWASTAVFHVERPVPAEPHQTAQQRSAAWDTCPEYRWVIGCSRVRAREPGEIAEDRSPE